MSTSDGDGPGQKPKQPASSTLAGMPPPKDAPAAPAAPTAPTRAPLPPPKAPPGGRSHSTSSSPPLRREISGAGPLPSAPGGPTPASGPHATPSAPASGPHAAPPSGSYAAPPSGSYAGPRAAPGAAPGTLPPSPSAPHAFPPQQTATFGSHPFTPPGHAAGPPGPPAGPSPTAAHAAAQHQPAFISGPGPGPTSIGTTQPQFGAIGRPPHAPGDSMEEVPGSLFVKFLKISSRRAFRLRIDPSEVLPTERAALERATPPILDANLQAFLAWRRSVLFLVAVALVPLSIIGLVDTMAGSMPTAIRVVKLGPALAEGVFCWICWTQLKNWSHWRDQRRKLFWGWLLFMAMPFIVFLYPLRTAVMESAGTPGDAARAFGVGAGAFESFVYAMIAMLQLAPKAISLMPGLIRASLVIKLLFPGSTAPGWLIVLCAPLYALLGYVVLIIPYQFTGSGWFISGVLGLIVGQIVLARAGFSLARPLLEPEALREVRRVRAYYLSVMIGSAILIVIALGALVAELKMRPADVITAVMKFETNVLILTMIGADLVITSLDRARSATIGKGHVEEQAEVKIAAFVSLDAPSTPPPPGPAR
jgi:hypothetical protein